MGVDSVLKVRIFQNGQSDYHEIAVSDQDNSLASLFFGDEVFYTSVRFDRDEELSAEENELLNLSERDEEEMLVCSGIIPAESLLPVIDKMHRKLYRRTRESLNNDLLEIDQQEIPDDEKTKKRYLKTGDYFDFESSLSILIGILKAASGQGLSVQIVNEFY